MSRRPSPLDAGGAATANAVCNACATRSPQNPVEDVMESPRMRLKALAVAALLASAALKASAVTVTLVGSSFSISYDDSLVGLFGTPTLVGNTLQWFPAGSPGFSAQTTAGIAVTNSTFALKVTALPGYTLSSFGFSEGGDYFFFGAPGSSSGVSASGQLRVTPLPGSTQTSTLVADSGFVANPFLDFGTKDWSASTSTLLMPTGTEAVNVTLENILAAYVLGGAGYAFIEKKEVLLAIATSPVPEPPSQALMLAGVGLLAALGLRRRRRH